MDVENYKWNDPDPNSTGVLLSDRIQFYVKEVNLIEPFHKRNLRPASYTLHVGDKFYCDDKPIYPNEKGEVVIHPNGLIYFKLKEKLNLPYYMIARHNLKVKQQYRGLLVGVSLHVDPGYSGYINYFAYNFTEDDKIIKVDEEIAVIDFIKTTSFGDKEFWKENKIKSKDELTKAVIRGLHDCECLKFGNKKDRTIPEYWIGGEQHKSSVLKLREDFKKVEKRVGEIKKSVGKIKNFSIIAVVSITLTFCGILLHHYYWAANNIISVTKEISDVSATTEQLRNEISELKERNQNKEIDQKLLEERNVRPSNKGK